MKKFLLTLVTLTSSLNAFTLKEALESTYEKNEGLRAKLYEMYAKQESVSQAYAGFRPQISASAAMGRTYNKSSKSTDNNQLSRDPVTRYTQDSKNVQLTISQNLYNGFQDVSNIAVSENEAQAAHWEFIAAEQEIFLNAVKAYADVIFHTKSVSFNEENEKFLNKQLQAVVLAKEVGEKTNVDVSHAKAALAEAKANHVKAKGELAKALTNYETLIGQPAENLVYPHELPQLPKTLKEFLRIAQQRNPKILQAQFASRSAKHSVDAQRGAFLPSLNLEGSLARSLGRDREKSNDDSLTKNRGREGSVFLKLSVPLYQGGADWAKLRQTNHTATQQRLNLQQAIKRVIEESTQVWEDLETTKENIANFLAQVEFSKVSRDGAFLAYEVGESSYLDALDAQNKLLKAQESLEEARKNLIIQTFTILYSMGALTHRDIQLNVKSYPIEEHYERVKRQWIGTDQGPENSIEKVKS